MPEFTARDVQALRQATGAGMLDAKRALEATGGDMEEAKQWLRVQGMAGAVKRADREAAEGVVALVSEGSAAAMAEVRCETDFVAKTPSVIAIAEQLADSALHKGEESVSELDGAVEELRISLKENISVGTVVRFEAEDGAVIGTYLHSQAGRGVNGVLVEVAGGTEDLAHDIAVHIAFARPSFVRRDDVPVKEVEAERATVEQISRNEGKPEAALPKIVEGRMQGWFKERCLLDQPYVRDEKQTIGSLLGAAEVRRFSQLVVGG
jgi:elongation factor Ts